MEELVRSRGLDLLVLDQTRPDIGMPVVKVLVPGLRHFWARFAPAALRRPGASGTYAATHRLPGPQPDSTVRLIMAVAQENQPE
ncbi:YcaO-like family protein [Streptomyces thermocarboxydus]